VALTDTGIPDVPERSATHKESPRAQRITFLDSAAGESKAFSMIGNVSNNTLTQQTWLRKNSELQNRILQRLASGRRINAGRDDPAGLIAATDLEAAIAALDAESRSLQRVHANANIADGQTAQLSSMMGELRSLAVASANTAGLSDAEVAANQMQIDNLSASIQRFAQDAISSLDGISLPDDGNEQLAEQLRTAANSVATLASGGANSLSSGDFNAIQAVIEDASTVFAEARGTIGAYQKYDVEARLNSLADEREALTAAHSQIMDVDYAEETSNLARSQVLMAASVKVLKIADQNAATVLDLLS
jgi:flagellin-like hook-associated protein FlgL